MSENVLSAVAGDDFVLEVALTVDGAAADPSEIKSCELIFHFKDGERAFGFTANKENVYQFYLDGAATRALYSLSGGETEYCIRVAWLNGTQNTPVHRCPMLFRGC